MKEYEWDELKSMIENGINGKIPKAFYTLMNRIEELEEKLNYRIDTVHQRITDKDRFG